MVDRESPRPESGAQDRRTFVTRGRYRAEFMPGFRGLVALCIFFASLGGCANAPSNLYRAFTEQKKKFSDMAIMMDFIMIEGQMGDTSKVDLIENRRVSGALLTLCADSLSRKGYPVRKTVLSSIGLIMQHAQPFRVVRTPEGRNTDAEHLPLGSPPFYVDDLFLPDTILGALMNTYHSLINLPERKEGITNSIPEAVAVGRQVECGTIAVVLVGGINVPVSKGIGTPTPNKSLTMGIQTLQGVSQLSMMIFIIDARSGEIIWDDRKFLTGGVVYPDKILRTAGDLLGALP
jgi:hypothetical protein